MVGNLPSRVSPILRRRPHAPRPSQLGHPPPPQLPLGHSGPLPRTSAGSATLGRARAGSTLGHSVGAETHRSDGEDTQTGGAGWRLELRGPRRRRFGDAHNRGAVSGAVGLRGTWRKVFLVENIASLASQGHPAPPPRLPPPGQWEVRARRRAGTWSAWRLSRARLLPPFMKHTGTHGCLDSTAGGGPKSVRSR